MVLQIVPYLDPNKIYELIDINSDKQFIVPLISDKKQRAKTQVYSDYLTSINLLNNMMLGVHINDKLLPDNLKLDVKLIVNEQEDQNDDEYDKLINRYRLVLDKNLRIERKEGNTNKEYFKIKEMCERLEKIL